MDIFGLLPRERFLRAAEVQLEKDEKNLYVYAESDSFSRLEEKDILEEDTKGV